ncbi:MAG: hypothetical protein IJS39_09245 [Synergistaceae bacterium]|nr:hypothetical protein [Synergistaceae bacterium]
MRKVLAVFAVILLLEAGAFAEIQEFRYFSLDVPEEWSVSEEGAAVTVTAPDKSASLSITADDPKGKTIAELAEEYSRQLNGTAPEKDGDDGESYSFEFNNGVSQAVIAGDEEMYLLIIGTGVERNADILGEILESLEMK